MIYEKNNAQMRRINRKSKYIDKAVNLLKEVDNEGLSLGEIARLLDCPLNRLGNYLSCFDKNNPELMNKTVVKKQGRWLSAYAYIGGKDMETDHVLNTCDGNGKVGEEI